MIFIYCSVPLLFFLNKFFWNDIFSQQLHQNYVIKIYEKSPKNIEKIHKSIAAEDSSMMKHGVQQKM